MTLLRNIIFLQLPAVSLGTIYKTTRALVFHCLCLDTYNSSCATPCLETRPGSPSRQCIEELCCYCHSSLAVILFFFFLLSRGFVSCFLSPSVSPRETPTAHLFPSDVNRDIHAVFFDFFFFKRDPLKSTLSSSIVIERRPAAFSRSIPNAVVFF